MPREPLSQIDVLIPSILSSRPGEPAEPYVSVRLALVGDEAGWSADFELDEALELAAGLEADGTMPDLASEDDDAELVLADAEARELARAQAGCGPARGASTPARG